jgi:hypothetical protein
VTSCLGTGKPLTFFYSVAEVGLRQDPVEAVLEANCCLGIGYLVAVHGVGAPQVVEGVHVLGDGAVHPAGQHVAGSGGQISTEHL